MANKYLDNDGVLYLWNKVKALVSGAVPTKTSDLTNDSGFITSADVPEGASASTATPLMDGTAAVGTSTAFARGDHRHPSDTNKVDKVTGYGLASFSSVTDGYQVSFSGDTVGSINVVDISTYQAAMGQAATALDAKANKVDSFSVNAVTVDNVATSLNLVNQSNSSTSYAVPTLNRMLSELQDKVDKETGKGLSTNDYTDAEKTKLAAFSSASDYALKSDITNMYKYKGSVATVSALPSSGQTTGDVYNVEATGMNYAWNGSAWDALGEIFTITAITNAELDTICT